MLKLVIFCILLPSMGISISKAQNIATEKPLTNTENTNRNSIIKINKSSNNSETKNYDSDFYNSFENSVRNSTKPILNPDRVPEKPKLDIVSSYRNNIHFGGFWNGYAILNFTPTMYIQPFSFISIYANHNFSNYVPLKDIEQNFKSLFIEGT